MMKPMLPSLFENGSRGFLRVGYKMDQFPLSCFSGYSALFGERLLPNK